VRPAAGGRSVTDELGRTVTVPARPRRIVSLAPNLTEMVFALGAGDRLVADTSYCNYPPEAAALPHVGDTQRPDVERILTLKPDLVLVSTASELQGVTAKLTDLGLTVYVSNPRDLDGVFASVERLGDVLDAREQAARLAASLRAREKAVVDAVAGKPSPKVFVVVSDTPLITSGKGTFLDDLIRRAGGASISGDEPVEWPQYSAETVVARAPDVIVVPGFAHGVALEADDLPEALRATPAARSGRVVKIDGDLLMRPGPRLVDGLEALARDLHPEAVR
jgi:iron complex transport system substrate-binding protein